MLISITDPTLAAKAAAVENVPGTRSLILTHVFKLTLWKSSFGWTSVSISELFYIHSRYKWSI